MSDDANDAAGLAEHVARQREVIAQLEEERSRLSPGFAPLLGGPHGQGARLIPDVTRWAGESAAGTTDDIAIVVLQRQPR